MNRYHTDVHIPEGDIDRLRAFTEALNAQAWNYTAHSLDNVKYRAIDCKALLYFIKDLRLNACTIFEYYTEGTQIIKACYRIKYTTDIDIILVISDEKNLVTVYMNSEGDNHYTLRKNLYCTS